MPNPNELQRELEDKQARVAAALGTLDNTEVYFKIRFSVNNLYVGLLKFPTYKAAKEYLSTHVHRGFARGIDETTITQHTL